ncbi:MAG: hypothetical protein KF812_03340 [Fimbriimonadaceae bacterium]|nr:hypothetical protein [Fimbriimonadaceae bacterium]
MRKEPMTTMRFLLISAALFTSATIFGFIEDKPAGSQFHAEQGQEQVMQQQQSNGTFDVVGEENLRGDNLGAEGPMQEQSAADVLAQKDSDTGAAVLKKVEADKSRGTPWWTYLLGALGVSCVIGGSFMAMKKYTDKNAPPPPSENSKIVW